MIETTAVRKQVPLMRVALYTGSFLVFLAGIQLFVLTTRTDHYFAWTIANPLTAAFLGAFYWTAIPLAFLSARRRVWADARVGVPGVLVFLWATLLTTLLHLGKFHFSSPDRFAKGAAWLWLIIYSADPSWCPWPWSSSCGPGGRTRLAPRRSPPGTAPCWSLSRWSPPRSG